MPTYEYVAIDQAGRTRSGVLSGADPEAARKLVERKGLVVTKIAPTARAAPAPKQPRVGKLSGKALALVSRQLATLVTVAPVEEALRTLATQTENAKVRRVLQGAHVGVVEGMRLSDAMGRVGAFPPSYRSMISAGEQSGSLPQVLERLADLQEREEDVRARIQTALVYPIVLAVVATAVIVALMTFVVPRVVDQFNASGQKLPALTEVVIFISHTLRSWGWLIGLILLALFALGAWAMTMDRVRLSVDRSVLGLPIVGRMLRDAEAASFARTLATMIGSGVPVHEALQQSARTSRNGVMREAAAKMAVLVNEGAGLSTAMRKVDVFPPLLVYLAANGESSGRLDDMLQRAADYLEREFRTTVSVALSLLEPAIIVIMGGVVCLVILSILLPILQINTLGVQ
ncbi:MAG: type II secretion system F family protein [Hyphomonadaceae bacterium]